MASIQTAEQLTVSNSIGHYINGSNVSDNSRLLEVTNPATGQIIRGVSAANKETVETAIKAAETAFPGWRNTPPLKRAHIMFKFKFKQLLEQHADDIVALITEDHGKVLDDGQG
jgi:malonate-semialdehyde dehydrogenase (acetylating)/methylmalonate-semialdehyde dehydrogenase